MIVASAWPGVARAAADVALTGSSRVPFPETISTS
jgi:hypothetical protein